MDLVFDGTFEGFLTLVYDVYYKKYQVHQIYTLSSDSLLSYDAQEIITQEQKAAKVYQAIVDRFESVHIQVITNSFLCDSQNHYKQLLEYIILGFKEQKNLQNINILSVFSLLELQKEYFRLVHKMYGFIRFEELEDKTLYAKIETKFNILPSLGKHFSQRLSTTQFIIHDIKRKLAFVKLQGELGIKEVASFEEPTLSDNEENFKKLWRVFFKSVSIQTRENKKLQQNLVPLIYRKYMSEFQTS